MLETVVEADRLIVTKTDTKGIIVYANPYFLELVGYKESELLNKPHNIIRHPDMPKAVFKFLWDNVKNGNEINAFVKNTTKSGNFYWVKGNITPSYDEGKIVGYFSVRRKANPESIKLISEVYTKMLEIEKASSVEDSLNYLIKILEERGQSYEEFISEL